MTAGPTKRRLKLAGSPVSHPHESASLSEHHLQRVSDVSGSATEWSGACARPVPGAERFAKALRWSRASLRNEVQRTESSESRCCSVIHHTPRQSAVFGEAVKSKAQARSWWPCTSTVAGANGRAKARSLSAAGVRRSRQRRRLLASVVSQCGTGTKHSRAHDAREVRSATARSRAHAAPGDRAPAPRRAAPSSFRRQRAL